MLRATSRLSRTAAAARGRGLMQLGAAMSTSAPKFTGKLACLDLEGVLIPEVWVNLAERVGVEALKRTTRDEPDYDKLMRYRLDIMAKEGLGIADINAAIESMDPLPGAEDMVAWLRERFQVVILSDTFYEFGMPFMKKLNHPTLFCHKLSIDPATSKITDFHAPARSEAQVDQRLPPPQLHP